MKLLNRLWRDEVGVILSAEAVLVGTVGVLGVVAGLSTISHAVEGELKEVGFAIRSLDQSYGYRGHQSCGAWTAGSSYIQPCVESSLADLGRQVEADVQGFQSRMNADRQSVENASPTPVESEKARKPGLNKNKKKGKRGPILEESSEPLPQSNDLPNAEPSPSQL